MTCYDIEVLIISSASAISTSPEAAAHIAGCESCERLVRELGKGGQASAAVGEFAMDRAVNWRPIRQDFFT
jgi:hypothetical protein